MNQQMTQRHKIISWLSGIWNLLTSPSGSIQDAKMRRQAQLVVLMSLLMFVFTTVGLLVLQAVRQWKLTTEFYQLVPLVLASLVGYLLSRSGYPMPGAWTLVLTLNTVGFAASITGGNPVEGMLIYAPFTFLIGVGLLSSRELIFLTALNLVICAVLPQFVPVYDSRVAMTIMGELLTIGCLSAIIAGARERLRRESLDAALNANADLKDLTASQERRLAEQTRDIALAAEVGRRISMMRDMDSLLSDAVELIREHFKLYYAQVYLTDNTRRSLILRAGTGEVGQELLSRSHRLLADLNSLNGTAVVERRAVIVEDTARSMVFRPHALLPETRSEMAVPLIAGEQVLGVLDLQSSQPGAFTEESLLVFETLAGQLAAALANARLLDQVQLTLTEAEERNRHDEREGWEAYLDAIENKERIGYVYDQVGVIPLEEELVVTADDCALTAPIQISGERLGSFQFVSDRPWLPEAANLVNGIAFQVAQQIENLRLLDQAQRYRREAEEAVRRLTREEWGEFVETAGVDELAFAYTDHQVQSLSAGQNGHSPVANFAIKVQNEAIGQFGIAGVEKLSPEEEELVAVIGEQLGAHLENMRLYTSAQQELEERRRTEQMLETQRRTLQAVLDNMAAGVFMVEAPSGRPILSNKKAEEFLGRGISPHAVGDDLNQVYQAYRFGTDELYPPQEMPIVAGMFGQSKVIDDMEVRRPDGSRVLLQVNGAPVYDASGTVVASAVVFQDITESRKSADQLRLSQEQLAEAMDAARLVHWEFDLASGCFTFNDAFYKSLGTTAEEEGGYVMPVPDYVQKFVHPEDAASVGAAMAETIQHADPKTIHVIESRNIRKDGDMQWIFVRSRVELNEQGQVARIFGANQDITEQKQASLELENQRRTLQAVLDNMPAGVFMVEAPSGRPILTNKKAEEFLGRGISPSASETDLNEVYQAYRFGTEDLYPPQEMPIVAGLYGKALTIGDMEVRKPDGERVLLEVAGTPIIDGSSNVTASMVMFTDITERHRAQETIAKRAEELAMVSQVATTVATIQSPDEMLQTVVDVTKQAFKLYHAHVYLLNETGDNLVLTSGAGEVGRKMVAENRQINLNAEKSLVARAARSRQAVTVNDIRLDPEFLPNPLLPDTRSEMAVPMVSGDRLLGVLDIQADVSNRFTDEDMAIQTTLASQVAVALQNARQLEQTQASEQLTRTVIDSTPDWIFIKDQQHRFRLVNKGYADSVHLKPEDIIGKNDIELGFPEELVKGDPERGIAGFWADDLAVMNSGEAKIIPNDIVVVDGKQRTLNTLKTPLVDASGSVWGVLGFCRDVTEREEILREMESQRRTLQAVLDNMPAGVFMVEAPSGRPILSNKKAEEFLGRGISPNAVGDDLNQVYQAYRFGTDDLYPPQEMPVVMGMFGQSKVINDMEVRRPDGSRVLLQVNGAPVYDASSSVVASVVVFQDITQAREAQELIAKRAVELATVAEVSTKVSTIQSPDEMLQMVVDLTKQAFGLYHAHIYLVNDAGDKLVLARGAGEVGQKMVAENRQINLDAEKSLVARAARSRQGVIVNDVHLESDFLPNPLLPDTRSEMAVPMVSGDRLLGVIDVQDEQVSRFTPEDVNIMTTLATQVAVSLQNARSYARAQRQAEREALINAISERIQATNSVETALQVAVREIGRALGAQHTAVRLGLERKTDDQ